MAKDTNQHPTSTPRNIHWKTAGFWKNTPNQNQPVDLENLTLAAVQKGIAIVMCLFQDGTELDAGGQRDD